MNDDRSKEPEDIPNREERENIDDVSTSSEGYNDSDSPGPSANRGRDSSELLGDGGQQPPGIDESILAELVDEDDSPEERKRKFSVVQEIVQHHRGPIPPAAEFGGYAEVDPAAPGIILDMAVNSNRAAANRLNAEAELVRANAEAVKANARIDEKAVPRGQYISGGLVLVLLVIAAIAVFLDRAWFGLLFGAGGVGIMFMNTLPSIQNRDVKGNHEVSELEKKEE